MKTFAILPALALVAACSASKDDETTPEAVDTAAPSPAPLTSAGAIQPPPILVPVPTRFRALGTEPFWSALVEGRTLTYSTPDTPGGFAIEVTRKDAGAGVVYTGTIDGKPIELEVRRETCSDGMSDTVYPFAVARRIGPETQRGCAR